MSLTELLEEVEKLTPAEKEKVRSVLDADQAGDTGLSVVERQKLLVKKLYEQGIIKDIPQRKNRSRVSRPVPIEGKPLSETIIEERR
jgi:hypothetical protein